MNIEVISKNITTHFCFSLFSSYFFRKNKYTAENLMKQIIL